MGQQLTDKGWVGVEGFGWVIKKRLEWAYSNGYVDRSKWLGSWVWGFTPLSCTNKIEPYKVLKYLNGDIASIE